MSFEGILFTSLQHLLTLFSFKLRLFRFLMWFHICIWLKLGILRFWIVLKSSVLVGLFYTCSADEGLLPCYLQVCRGKCVSPTWPLMMAEGEVFLIPAGWRGGFRFPTRPQLTSSGWQVRGYFLIPFHVVSTVITWTQRCYHCIVADVLILHLALLTPLQQGGGQAGYPPRQVWVEVQAPHRVSTDTIGWASLPLSGDKSSGFHSLFAGGSVAEATHFLCVSLQ